jgi:anti-anti-sigma factor
MVVGTRPDRVRLVGELDLAGAPELRACLAGVEGDIEVDCSGLTFIDAAGLGVFVAAHHACEARGVRLLVVDPPACMLKVLALTELDALLHVHFDGLVS